MKQRIIGFDLARAYAIFGMYIVNFNFSFGSIWQTTEPLGRFLNLFTGNSTAIFILLAGMGVSFLTGRETYNNDEKAALKSRILKRSWFLFALGLLLYNWWPGDILHFYGGYMHIAALMVFLPRRYYLWLSFAAIIIFHILLFIIPIETGWDFTTFRYTDFWTITGFLRNTLYNGWNAIFPWLAYFMGGMWLGRLNWQDNLVKRNVFIIGFALFSVFQALRYMVTIHYFNDFWSSYIMSEYFPAYIPFMMITAGFAFMVLSICMYIGEKFSTSLIIGSLAKTGQLTLTLYVIHLTIGALILAFLTGKQYTGFAEDELPTPPAYILGYAIVFYFASILFSALWLRKFKTGPLETIMRKISG
jgi:uncharacterized protein